MRRSQGHRRRSCSALVASVVVHQRVVVDECHHIVLRGAGMRRDEEKEEEKVVDEKENVSLHRELNARDAARRDVRDYRTLLLTFTNERTQVRDDERRRQRSSALSAPTASLPSQENHHRAFLAAPSAVSRHFPNQLLHTHTNARGAISREDLAGRNPQLGLRTRAVV